MKYGKMLISTLFVIFAAVLFSNNVAAIGANIDNVYLDGVMIKDTGINGITSVDRGDQFTLKIEVTATEPTSDVQVEAQIIGVHNEQVSDITDTFDMKANVTYLKKLTLKLPDVTDQDRYRLRVRVEDRSGATQQKDYMLQIEAQRNLITIKDVTFNPDTEVKAGRSLLTTVRVKNMGEYTEEGIKIKVSIPDLGIAVSDNIDKLESEESTTSEEMYLRIPTCAQPGDYDVGIEVTYDDGAKSVDQMESIKVVEDETCPGQNNNNNGDDNQGKTQVVVPQTRDVKKGTGGTAYPITITNGAPSSQTFTLGVSGVDTWGTSTFDPSNVLVVPAKGTSTAFLYLTANNDAVNGKHTFALSVSNSAGTETLPIEANVLPADNATSIDDGTNLRRILEIALIVFVILLVLLGLIIAFTKMKEIPPKKEEEVVEQKPTYY